MCYRDKTCQPPAERPARAQSPLHVAQAAGHEGILPTTGIRNIRVEALVGTLFSARLLETARGNSELDST